ncbi:hypothetical protein PMKS-002076 [Pichia membranifaciens]|uniref:Uncharacterized protein n=1 Tax=Pichia membranifaciens TaxID=4926 RepID=A0A1Q2YGE4_9ASCO|nr:hypothetical protein PMKS-002076 [Pichia membranifaciens]
MLFTNIDSKPQKIDEIVEVGDNAGEGNASEHKEDVPAAKELSTENKENVDIKSKEEELLEKKGLTVVEEKKVPEETKVYKHLKTYPIVNSWIKIFHWFPLPMNQRLIEDINTFFPAPSDNEEIPINYVTFDNQSNELSYTLRLINLALLRSRPVLQERFQQLTEAPSEARKYVAAVYQESQEHRGEGRIVIIIATLETIRKIVTDGYEAFSANRFFQFLLSEPTAEEKISIAEETQEAENDSSKKAENDTTEAT